MMALFRLILGLSLAAAASLAPAWVPSVWAATPAAASPVALIGRMAPDFVLPSAGGDNVRLSEYVGQPVVLTFWSSDCGLCAAQLRQLDRLYATYQSAGLMVLAVSVDDDMARAARYAREHRMHYPMLLDQVKAVARAYGVDHLPGTLLIDRSGVVRYLHDAYRANDRTYITQIRALLDDDATSHEPISPAGD